MAYRLMSLDKRTRVRPVGVEETLRRALAKLVMRSARDQEKTACGNLQLCAGLKAGIEISTNAVGQRRLARVLERRGEEEDAEVSAKEEEEEDSGRMVAWLNNLSI